MCLSGGAIESIAFQHWNRSFVCTCSRNFFSDLRLIFMEFPRTFKSITNNVDSLIYYSLRINCRHIKTPKKKTKQNIVVFVITFVCSRFHEAFFVLDTLNARIFFLIKLFYFVVFLIYFFGLAHSIIAWLDELYRSTVLTNSKERKISFWLEDKL